MPVPLSRTRISIALSASLVATFSVGMNPAFSPPRARFVRIASAGEEVQEHPGDVPRATSIGAMPCRSRVRAMLNSGPARAPW
jgi:hypothetical protein